jgi:hypothetical protein
MAIETTIAAMSDEDALAAQDFGDPYIHWRAVIAGAIAAAALGFVLHGFAAAIGLSLSSTSPSWRDASFALTLLAGLYLLVAAILAYGLGGYIAGRASLAYLPATAQDRTETEFRDGTNGLVAWALATLLAGLLAFGALQSATRSGAPRSQPNSIAENLIAFDLDHLFRSDRPLSGDVNYARAEAGRILLTANSHEGMQADDHDYLARLVARTTGLASADATHRVDEVAGRSREDVARARRTAVVLAFMSGVAALIGAVIAWAAACAGGRHRDGLGRSHLWDWQRTNRRLASMS